MILFCVMKEYLIVFLDFIEFPLLFDKFCRQACLHNLALSRLSNQAVVYKWLHGNGLTTSIVRGLVYVGV